MSDLAIACFTFAKRAIFHEPEERIRHASSNRCRQSLTKLTSKTVIAEDVNEQVFAADDSGSHLSKKLKPLRIVLSPTKIYSVDNAERTSDSGDKVSGDKEGDDLLTDCHQLVENMNTEGSSCSSNGSQSESSGTVILSLIKNPQAAAEDVLSLSNVDLRVNVAHMAADDDDNNDNKPHLVYVQFHFYVFWL